ncbi:LysR substrate-binding domain-containing protein [Candidatus Rhodoblastus alkanivorans]|uniref:LysR substrate-binding domain-containing protein n=1 Tax=Candidatus Rhodoblastus alkanivorans TaxID=2954117 RepID=UPI00235157A6|nr:LysR substrate-binding domain-containing protein [Candidatus Rhodoblastus alkanivorans]
MDVIGKGRWRLEEWLVGAAIAPERILEFGSYHAIAACVAAGAGVAMMPLSVLESLAAKDQVTRHILPRDVARSRTHLVWRAPASPALDALLAIVGADSDREADGRGTRPPPP